jgi:hypothetical protein
MMFVGKTNVEKEFDYPPPKKILPTHLDTNTVMLICLSKGDKLQLQKNERRAEITMVQSKTCKLRCQIQMHQCIK